MARLFEPLMSIDANAEGSSAVIEVVNPATRKVIGQVPDCSRQQLDRAVAAARRAFAGWSARAYRERQDALCEIAGALMRNIDELKTLLTLEQGKPHADAEYEIRASAWWITQIADQALPVVTTDAMPGLHGVTTRVPLGVVGAIVPWNFPLLLAIWKIGPALLTGNTLVLKPSPFTPLSTLRLGELLRPLLPPGVINIVTGGDQLGPWISEHPGIDKISFTGSTATGKRVMVSAAGNLKRLTLELGGNDPAIVLPDVDVDAIAEPLFWAAFKNSGQVCVAAKRIYIHADVYDALAEALVRVAEAAPMGDGATQGNVLGPVQNALQFERVKAIIDDSREQGHTFLIGGSIPESEGYFVPATIVDNPPDNSRVVQEEAFGPIVPLLRFYVVDDAVSRANATEMGLAGSVWSPDVKHAAEIAARLEVGTVWVNSAQGLTPFAAFAGRKQSGIGVEGGLEGLLEFTAPQTIYSPV